MVTPNPSAEGSGGPPSQPPPPEPTRHAAGTAGRTAGSGDDRHGDESPGDGRRPVRAAKIRRHPAVLEQQAQRAAHLQVRLADWITAYAGSMNFVYLHVALFAIWMLLIERSPWPTLTLIVSLEAIFLSTFVMIGQNRQAAFQQAKADRDFNEQELELKTNTELTRQIHVLTTELHKRLLDPGPAVVLIVAARPDMHPLTQARGHWAALSIPGLPGSGGVSLNVPLPRPRCSLRRWRVEIQGAPHVFSGQSGPGPPRWC